MRMLMRFRPNFPLTLTLFLYALLASCQTPVATPVPAAALPTALAAEPNAPTSPPATTAAIAASTAVPEARSQITIPMVVYILDDLNETESSLRTVAEVAEIYERVNTIWGQADVILDVLTIERVSVPTELLQGLTQRDFFTFFSAVNQGDVALPEFAPIVGFYVKELGGPNGINPSNSNTFFVMDEPSVFDERVTSHEVGHILGLHHELDDAGRLMFSGTNGIELTEEEQAVARYSAAGLLARVR